MLDSSYFEQKRRQLGLDRGDSLSRIQLRLDALYPALTRAKSLNRGILRIITSNASVASELRLRQIELLEAFRHEDKTIERLAISIGQLRG